jgi:hypothetical protein
MQVFTRYVVVLLRDERWPVEYTSAMLRRFGSIERF